MKFSDTCDMQGLDELHLKKQQVLVVDDDTDLRLTLLEYLSSMNFSVSSARDGAEAISLLKDPRLEFDIVLSDLDMPPGPGGLAVMKAAKQLHPLSHVIIMTGYSGLETALDGIRHGAFDYIAKPFKLIEIEILVDRIQERLKLLDDNKRLSQRLGSMTTHLQTMNSRLERIESAICRIAANVPGGH